MPVKLEGVRYKRIILALLALVVVMLALILLINVLPSSPGTFSGRMESHSLEEATTTEAVTFTVEQPDAGFMMTLEAGLSAGSLTWNVLDPSGAVRAAGSVAAGDTVSEVLSLEAMPGDWQVVVEAQAATGAYVIEWQGQN